MTAAGDPFLRGSGLPARWRRQERFVVLDTDFRRAGRFLACWQAWRAGRPPPVREAEPHPHDARHHQLHVIAIATRMPSADELRGQWSGSAAHDPPPGAGAAPSVEAAPSPFDGSPGEPLATMAAALLADWPPAVPGLHRLAFDGGEVQLLLAAGGGARQWLPQLVARVDAFFIDGDTLTTEADPSWPLRLFKAAGRLAVPQATLVVPSPDDAALAALRTAGFVRSGGGQTDRLGSAPDDDPPATGSLWCGHHAPTFASRRAANLRTAAGPTTSPASAPPCRSPVSSSQPPGPPDRHAFIVGAGLAGCAAAWALAELGWRSTLLDRHDAPAREASGNPGGLFHGTVHRQDGAHARFNRAAALEARRAVGVAIARHGVSGGIAGLLRIEPAGQVTAPGGRRPAVTDDRPDEPPADYARIVDAAEASALAGIPLAWPCRYFPGGGWVQPAGLARAFIERGGARVRFVGGVSVASLRRCRRPPRPDDAAPADGRHRPGAEANDHWQLIGPAGQVLGESAVVVLAHAGAAAALLSDTGMATSRPASKLPAAEPAALQSVRGQLSALPLGDLAPALPGLALPRLPIVGSGWLLPAVDGLAVFGATSQANDADPAVRTSDHAANVAALGRLTGLRFADQPPPALQGRTAWRCVAKDRLPLIGAVPCGELDSVDGDRERRLAPAAAHTCQPGDIGRPWRADRVEDIARLPGLYTFSALGSRGIGWAALGAQVLASLIAGSPVPLSRRLIEAVDPGRFVLRRRRHERP